MKKHTKILTALSLTACSLAGAFTAQNASAANYVLVGDTAEGKNPSSVQVCHTINNFVGKTINNTFDLEIGYEGIRPSGIDFSKMTVGGSGSKDESSTADSGKFTIVFNKSNITDSTLTECVTLNLLNVFSKDVALGEYTFVVEETGSSDNVSFPIDEDEEGLNFSYLLDVDENNNPVIQNGSYVKKLSVKNNVGFSNNTVAEGTYISVKKIIKGNLANPDDTFKLTFKLDSNVDQAINSSYKVAIDGIYNKTCSISYNCEVEIKANQVAFIGYENGKGQLIPGSVKYSFSETDNKNYTPQYLTLTTDQELSQLATYTEGWTSSAISNKVVGEGSDSYGVKNTLENNPTGIAIRILPFILLAAIAGAAVVIVRKTTAKEEK